MPAPLTAIVITVSDSAFNGERQDLSGPAVQQLLKSNGFTIVGTHVVCDDAEAISGTLIEHCDRASIIITTGGTGITARDVTPEATRAVCDRIIEGISELMRAEGLKKTRLAAISRAVCGSRGQTLILNLPGSPKGAVESLQAVIDLLPHMIDLLHGHTVHPENFHKTARSS